MKIALLIQNLKQTNHKRFLEVGTARGHQVFRIHLSFCYMSISRHAPTIYYRSNQIFQDLNAIIPILRSPEIPYGTAVLRQFERMGVYTLNNSISLTWARDKLRALQQIAKKKLPMPITGFADAPQETERLIEIVGGAPLIIRLLESPEGKHVIFAETNQAAVSVINAFKQLKTSLLVQEYIQEAQGSDIRCVVVGNKVVAAIQRSAKEIGFHKPREFILRGQPVEISNLERKMALNAAKAMKLNLATVDLIRSSRGPLVLDVDASPHIEFLEKVTKTDIITPIFELLEQTQDVGD